MIVIFINKIGYYHIENGLNCQDYGFINDNIKCVVDGCSDGINSEVGAKLFCHLFNKGMDIKKIFPLIIDSMFFDYRDVKNNLCFTILFVEENDNEFTVNYCGDGFIIKKTINDEIEFEKLDDGEYPKYLAYNYIDKSHLSHYQDGVNLQEIKFSKNEYKNIGIASDGLRYIFNQDYEEDFISYLKLGKESALKRLINKECKKFKDDITLIL